MNDIFQRASEAWESYAENPDESRQDYKEELADHADEAAALAEETGLDALDEAAWGENEGVPRVDGSEDDVEYPYERGTADVIADAYNTFQLIQELADAFPYERRLPEKHDVDRESSFAVRRELNEQHGVDGLDELRDAYVDEETGEPLYDSRRELREQIRDIAKNDAHPSVLQHTQS